MPASEIDDIFASKGKQKAAVPPKASSSASVLPDKKKKKKKDKEKSAKRKREDDAGEGADAAPGKLPNRPVPETVFDPSSGLPSSGKAKVGKTDKPAVGVAKPKRPKKDREDEDRFKDSRGTGPRTFRFIRCPEPSADALPTGRKTEEGFSIYKEDELGINAEGGGESFVPSSPVQS